MAAWIKPAAKLYDTILRMDDFQVLCIFIVVFFVLHLAYSVIAKWILRKLGVRNPILDYAVDSSWQLCVKVAGLTIVLATLQGRWPIWNWIHKIGIDIENCLSSKKAIISDRVFTLLKIAMLTEDSMNHFIIDDLHPHGFYQKEVFLAVFTAAKLLQCTSFGIALVIAKDLSESLEMLTKVFLLAFSQTRLAIFENMTKISFVAYVSWWVVTCICKCINVTKMITDNKAMITDNNVTILAILVWVYLIINVTTSAFTRIVLSYLAPDNSRPRIMVYFLFACDPWLARLTNTNRRVYELVDDDLRRDRRGYLPHGILRSRRRQRQTATQSESHTSSPTVPVSSASSVPHRQGRTSRLRKAIGGLDIRDSIVQRRIDRARREERRVAVVPPPRDEDEDDSDSRNWMDTRSEGSSPRNSSSPSDSLRSHSQPRTSSSAQAAQQPSTSQYHVVLVGTIPTPRTPSQPRASSSAQAAQQPSTSQVLVSTIPTPRTPSQPRASSSAQAAQQPSTSQVLVSTIPTPRTPSQPRASSSAQAAQQPSTSQVLVSTIPTPRTPSQPRASSSAQAAQQPSTSQVLVSTIPTPSPPRSDVGQTNLRPRKLSKKE